ANDNLKDTEAKIEKAKADQAQQQAQQAQQHAQQVQEAEQAKTNEAARQQAIAAAKDAIGSGDLKSAAASITIAKKLGPMDPDLQRLDSLVQSKLRLRNQIRI